MDKDNRLEIAINVIIVLVGILCVVAAKVSTGDDFAQSLFLGLGTNLIVVTFVFAVFQAFRRRDSSSMEIKSPEVFGESAKMESFAAEIRSNQSPTSSEGSKVVK